MAEIQPDMEHPDAPPRPERERDPLDAFMYHQRRAMMEMGRAVLGLLPREFRTHTENALEESKASWEALFDGMIDTVQDSLEKVRSSPREETGGKVNIDIE